MSDRVHEAADRQKPTIAGALPLTAIFAALRSHQWLKNLLVFVPTLAAHDFGAGLVAATIGFLSFSLCASSVYIINDLVDRVHDRAHPRKRFRPFASGALGTAAGLWMASALLLAGLVVGLYLSWQFLLVLLGYFALSALYSLRLKGALVFDIVALACLYGVRVAAGGAAAGVTVSPWLAIFALFIFFCLATVKRCAELAEKKVSGGTILGGRAYRVDDLPALFAMAAASGFVSILVLALYVNSDAVRAAYTQPERMLFACIPLMLWVSRVLLLTHRGQMHDDPIVFAATDRVSPAVALACGLIVIASL